jgi:hypothetical protein
LLWLRRGGRRWRLVRPAAQALVGVVAVVNNQRVSRRRVLVKPCWQRHPRRDIHCPTPELAETR